MRHRSGGQTIVFAAIAMVALVGGVAMVVDTGMFFVIQRQLHSASDAGALAGAWHDPICPFPIVSGGPPPPAACQAGPAAPAKVGVTAPNASPWDTCKLAPPAGVQPSCARCDGTPGFAACDVALANAESIAGLCNGVIHATVGTGTTLFRPSKVNVIVVTLECDAGYSFGRILGLFTKHISASSAAALGNRDATTGPTCPGAPGPSDGGDMKDLNPAAPCGFIARLIE